MNPFLATPPLLFVNESRTTLMKYAPPYGFKFQKFGFPHLERFMTNATYRNISHYKQCAVIGNSGILLKGKHGAFIDKHDAVFRTNHAPTKKFSTHVGTKTTFHVTSSHWIRELKDHKSRSFLVICDRPFVYSCQNILFAKKYSNVHLINPLFYRYLQSFTPRSKIPLTGFVSIAIALHLCDKVNIFGFTVNTTDACDYYYSCKSTDKAYHLRKGDHLYHNFAEHRKLLQHWIRNGVLKLIQ